MISDYFNKKKPNPKKLMSFGFKKEKKSYIYSTDIMNNDFNLCIEVVVSEVNSEVKTKVLEKATNEEYTLHFVKSADGAFIRKVREEYESVLKEISEKCFETEIFQSKEAKSVIKYIDKKYGDKLEYLWPKFPDNAICRRKDNKKWYFVIMTVPKKKFGFDSDAKVEVIDLRALPEDIPNLVKKGNIYQGYHMNKKHWITIIFDGSVNIDEIFERIDNSYNLALK